MKEKKYNFEKCLLSTYMSTTKNRKQESCGGKKIK